MLNLGTFVHFCFVTITSHLTLLNTLSEASDVFGTDLGTRWSYKPADIDGPAAWGAKSTSENALDAILWPLCQRGRQQSPIDIQTDRLVFDHSLKEIVITGNDEQLELVVENIGQDLRLSITSDPVTLSGGPLSYQFRVFAINIKFGSVSSRGSDHKIDGKALPGELTNTSNKDLLGVVAAAEKTIFEGQQFQLRGIELRSLLSSTQEYMTYEGSIPFPGCQETVTWVILNHPIAVSETELKSLRRLQVAQTLWSGSMADNFRPIQQPNSRSVRTNINFYNSMNADCTMKKHISYIANIPETT